MPAYGFVTGDRRMDRMFLRRFAVIGGLALGLGAALSAPPGDVLPAIRLPGESPTTARRLAEAAQRADKQQWAEAVEEYQRILEEAGDDLVPLDPRKRAHCLQARRLCAMQIARHPPLLRLYRARVDDQAKKWLEQGVADRDPAALRQLVTRAFCSRHADRALEMLGDLAFERGDLAEAEQWWRLLARPVSEAKSDTDLLYPDPRTDVALVRAKSILSRLLRGEHAGAQVELKAFAAAHGKAEGYLAGRKGNLLEIVKSAAGHAGDLPAAAHQDWPTLGGSGSRTAIAAKPPRCRWLAPPWRVPLAGGGKPKPRTATQQAQACVFQPVIAGNLVLLADDRSVSAFDLVTGRRRGQWELPEERPGGGNLSAAQQCGARYTLTVAGNRVFVRLGSPPTPLAKGDAPREALADSYLVCLTLPPDREGRLTTRWQIKARTPDADSAFFEGSPLVHDERVYIGRTRMAKDGRAMTAVECYEASTGEPYWRQDICDPQDARDGAPRCRYHLLTRAGPNVVYCSHAGAVVAVDAVSGRRTWAIRYPRRGHRLPDGTVSPRDLAPAVYADGRLFIAPADLDRILCLDAATGRTVWESNTIEVSQLIGVARGRLIFTTASFPAGIRAVDAATGRDLRGWLQPSGDSNGLPTVGRGLLAGEWVLWPTVNGLRILTQEDGEPAAEAYLPLDNQITGNLAVAQGCLVAATDHELLGYVPQTAFLEPRRRDVQADPNNARKRLLLGQAQVSAGLAELAVKEFTRAERQTKSPELRRQARHERHSALLLLAEQEAKDGQTEKAASALRAAAASEFPITMRLVALARLAELQEKCGQAEAAVATWQAVLADASLRHGQFLTPEGIPRSAAQHAFRQIDGLIARHGADVYKHFEARAKAVAGPDTPSAEQLARLVAEFPNSAQTPALLRQAAARMEADGREGAAARLHRRLLQWPVTLPQRALALVALARHYERRGAHQAARTAWNRLVHEHGEQKIAQLAPARTVKEVAAAELQRLARTSSAVPDLGLPLTRAWQVAIDGGANERLLATRPSDADPLFFARADGMLVCCDTATGKELWKTHLGSGRRQLPVGTTNDSLVKQAADALHSPIWLAHQGDLVIAAGPHGIIAFDGPNGSPFWSFVPDLETGTLGSFERIGSRLVCVQDERRMWALDTETGTVLWSLWAPGAQVGVSPPHGRFHAFAAVGPDQIVIQPSHGQAWLVDARTGRKLQVFDARANPWRSPPVVIGEHRVCLQPDPQHLIVYEVSSGKAAWRHQVDRPIGLSGELLQTAVAGDGLLAIIPRNHGFELIRLDAASGKPSWAGPRFLGVDRPVLADATWDRDAVYLPIADVLHALSLVDGKRLWTRPLGAVPGGWRVRRTRNYLLVHPNQAAAEMPFGLAVRRYLPTAPGGLYPTPVSLFTGLPGVLTWLCREQSPSRFVLIACSPRDGRQLQRLDCGARGTSVGVSVAESGLVLDLGETIEGWK